MSNRKWGRFYGVGVGPGDPELLTLRAHRILTQCRVVCTPTRRLSDQSYAWSIIREYLDPARQEILPLEFPMARDWQQLAPYWQRAAEESLERLQHGLDCVFVTEGDPFFYSTFIYVYEQIRRQEPEVAIEVVPGVSSFLAGAARLDMPLAVQDERIAVIPGVQSAADARQVLEAFDTVVFLKVSPVFDRVYEALESLGLIEKARVITKATAPGAEEMVTDIRTLRGRKLEYLSLLIVRKSHGG